MVQIAKTIPALRVASSALKNLTHRVFELHLGDERQLAALDCPLRFQRPPIRTNGQRDIGAAVERLGASDREVRWLDAAPLQVSAYPSAQCVQ